MAKKEIRDIEVRFKTLNAKRAMKDIEDVIAAEEKKIRAAKRAASQLVKIEGDTSRKIARIRKSANTRELADVKRQERALNYVSGKKSSIRSYSRNKNYAGWTNGATGKDVGFGGNQWLLRGMKQDFTRRKVFSSRKEAAEDYLNRSRLHKTRFSTINPDSAPRTGFARAGGGGSGVPPIFEKGNAGAYAWGNAGRKFMDVRNSLGSIATVATQAVGELTMFAGALTMVGFMATAAMTKLMALGDAFATSETNFLVGAGFRQSLIRKGGVGAVAGFDRANELSRRYSGLDEFSSGAQLARATTRFREMGGSTSESSMKNLVTAAYGASAITGDTADKTMSKVLEVAKKGKGSDKLGLAELKLTKNMDENLNIIANAIKKDPIASTILKRGTIASAMQRIRSAPAQLMGKVRGLHGEQTSRIFNRVGNSIMNAAESPKVIAAWSQVLTNLENVVKVVFTDENMERAAIGAAQWAAELTVAGGNLINSFRWFLENSETVLTWIERIATIWAGITAFKLGAGIVKFGLDLIALKGSIGTAIGTLNGATGSLVKSISGVAFGVASALAGIWMAVNDFKEGKANAEKWGVGKTNAGVSSFIGGTGSGVWGAANNALKWGAIGAGIGSFIPVVGTGVGAAIGAGFGAITGYAGGQRLSQAAHESMYGPINPPGAYHNSATANAQANYMPAWNNPNAKVIVIPGELTLNSGLHLSEQFMTGGAGEF